MHLPPEARPVLYRVPLVFDPQPEGGFTVTSPALPELVTEGDTLAEAHAHAQDALAAAVELYAEPLVFCQCPDGWLGRLRAPPQVGEYLQGHEPGGRVPLRVEQADQGRHDIRPE